MAEAFRLLRNYRPIPATVTSVGITDTTTGSVASLAAE
jgi:hypothetical protein